MNVISKPKLLEAARDLQDPQLLPKVLAWYELAKFHNFNTFPELKQVFSSADLVAGKVVFNLGSYRLITGVYFRGHNFYFKALLTHSEYEKGKWK